LQHRLLLHLPRFSPVELDAWGLDAETERLATVIAAEQARYRDWTTMQRIVSLEKSHSFVREVSLDVARVIHEKFHYIGNFRGGTHLGAYHNTDTVPFVMATVSVTDLELLKTDLTSDALQRTMFVSRIYAFQWAPPNSISYLLGAIRRRLFESSGITALFTWVNPNLGFRAASYRASNWHLYARHPLRYRYVDGKYVTARQFCEMLPVAPSRVQFSQVELAPLELWCSSDDFARSSV
jgi:hypothetical protein